MNDLEKINKKTEEELQGKELYEFRKRQKQEEQKKDAREEKRQEMPRKIGKYLLYGAVGIALVGGLGWFISTRPSLPPTSMQGHIEDNPKAHIVDTPMPDNIQRHMLEHADGKGKPGIIVQYNCKKYSCEPDLVTKLTDLVKQYPNNVYLAPNDYDGKIILTKLNKSKILDGFDELAIKSFIKP